MSAFTPERIAEMREKMLKLWPVARPSAPLAMEMLDEIERLRALVIEILDEYVEEAPALSAIEMAVATYRERLDR